MELEGNGARRKGRKWELEGRKGNGARRKGRKWI